MFSHSVSLPAALCPGPERRMLGEAAGSTQLLFLTPGEETVLSLVLSELYAVPGKRSYSYEILPFFKKKDVLLTEIHE